MATSGIPCLVGGKAPGRRPWNSLTRPQGALSAASQKSLRSTRRSTAGPPSNALSERAGRPRSSLSACCRRSPKAGRLQALVSQTGRACAHGQAGPAGVRLADEACESVSQADPCRCPLAGGSLRTPDSRPPPRAPGRRLSGRPNERFTFPSLTGGKADRYGFRMARTTAVALLTAFRGSCDFRDLGLCRYYLRSGRHNGRNSCHNGQPCHFGAITVSLAIR